MGKGQSKRSGLKTRLSSASLGKLFQLNKKRAFDSGDGGSSGAESNGGDGGKKRARLDGTGDDEARVEALKRAMEEEERKLDAKLPEELRRFRPRGHGFNLPPTDRPVRIYADGVFDLFHLGHMKQLEQCKKSFPEVTLICGVPSDKVTHKLKGLTVLSDKQRCETLRHCKWVDEVVEDAPWCVTPKFLEEHAIDYVAHDDLPYVSADSDDIYKPIKEMGKFLTTQRTDGVSTSDIITKIIRDYDKYLMRNFARGATRQELNVSWLKKNELEFKKHIGEFRSYFKKNQENLNNVSKDLYFEVRELLLKKTMGKQLYAKLAGNEAKKQLKNVDKRRRLIKEASPATEFASQYTGVRKMIAASSNNESATESAQDSANESTQTSGHDSDHEIESDSD